MTYEYDYFQNNGYIVLKKLINEKKIDILLDELNSFKDSNKLYYSQSDHNWIRVKDKLDNFNLLGSSFENFTNLMWANSLKKAGRDILQSDEILEALKSVSKEKKFCMWQNMFFDKSTGTVDHIDSWYLDTSPMGNLVAAWIALENIDGSGGNFHIYPKSHKKLPSSWMKLNHDEFVKWSNEISKNFKKKEILLDKGDVLLWHPLLLHGSSSQVEEGKSRKSLTAHYYPMNFLRGGGGKEEQRGTNIYKIKVRKQNSKSRNFGYKIYCRDSRRVAFKASISGFIKYYLNFKNSPNMLMNRLKYKFLTNESKRKN